MEEPAFYRLLAKLCVEYDSVRKQNTVLRAQLAEGGLKIRSESPTTAHSPGPSAKSPRKQDAQLPPDGAVFAELASGDYRQTHLPPAHEDILRTAAFAAPAPVKSQDGDCQPRSFHPAKAEAESRADEQVIETLSAAYFEKPPQEEVCRAPPAGEEAVPVLIPELYAPEEVTVCEVNTQPHRIWTEDEEHLVQSYNELVRKSRHDAGLDVPKNFMWRVATDKRFSILCAIVIIANLLYMLVQTSLMLEAEFERIESGRAPKHRLWIIGDTMFCIFFCAELVIRVAAFRWGFVAGRESLWNLFDTVIVVSAFLEVIADLFPGSLSTKFGISILRTARVYRIIRIMRVAGSITIVRNVKTMLFALMGCGGAFISAAIMLTGVLCVFVILFMDNVRRAVRDGTPDEQESLREQFGSAGMTFWTLLCAVTGGIDWSDMAHPLIDINPFSNTVLIISYVICMYLGVMNILNGIFVNAAMQSSLLDREIATDIQMREQKKLVRQMMYLFAEADLDLSGYVTWEEFKTYMQHEEVRAYFMALDLDMDSISKIFKLLDEDNSGSLALPEFLEGCLRLKGYAKMVDLTMFEDKIGSLLRRLESATNAILQQSTASETKGTGTNLQKCI